MYSSVYGQKKGLHENVGLFLLTAFLKMIVLTLKLKYRLLGR